MVKDKVAIITGSARGIGFEIGRIFAENGAKVVLSDVNQSAVEESSLALRNEGFDVIGVKADVTSEDEIIQLIEQTKQKFGRIDIFINNAGLQHVSPIEEFPTEKFELMIKIMLTAP